MAKNISHEITTINLFGASFTGYLIDNVFYSSTSKMAVNLIDYTTFRYDELPNKK